MKTRLILKWTQTGTSLTATELISPFCTFVARLFVTP